MAGVRVIKKNRGKITLKLTGDEVFEHQTQQGFFSMGSNAFVGTACGL